uniref:ABC transporter substrate-binding protein n=2 Tax=Natrinema halophilum TaxID=1699371 RepID=A0A7D5KRJ0_9EURY
MSGPSASVGEEMKRGAELAKEKINSDGGIDGQDVNLHIADTESEPAAGRNAVSSLLQTESIDVLTGGFHTDVSVAVMELAAQEEVPQMISNSVGGTINTRVKENNYKHSFKMAPPHEAYGVGWAAWLQYLQENEVGYFPFDSPQIALVGENTSYGNPIVDSVESNLQESDGNWDVLSKDSHEYNETDFQSLLTRIESNDPDIILCAQSNPSAAGNFISDFGDVGFEDTHLLMTWTPSNPTTLETGGSTSNGVLWLTNIGVLPSQSETLRSAWNDAYDSSFPGTNASLAYDNLLIVAKALKEIGGVEDLDVSTWEETVLNLEYEGTAGTFRFQEENHQSEWGPDSGIPPLGNQVRDMSNHLVWPDEHAEAEIDEGLY